MDKTAPSGEASRVQKMSDWSLLLPLNKMIH